MMSTDDHSPDVEREIPILYESNRILIINKPTGIAHHNDHGADANTNTVDSPGILNLVRDQRGERLWGVHRLDRVTSGILIFAKDVEMAQALTTSFAQGEISKVYVGISKKRPSKKKQGWVQGGMVRSRDKSWRLDRTMTSTNVAKTRFFSAPILCHEEKFTLLLFRPYTGKTHQLRVAAKAMGMPLWGDPIYKDGSTGITTANTKNGLQPTRTYLHASGVWIPPLLDHSQGGIAIWCPPPFEDILGENMSALPNLMRKYCDIPQVLDAMERHQ